MYNFDPGYLGNMQTQNSTRSLMFDFFADICFSLLLAAVFNQGRKFSSNFFLYLEINKMSTNIIFTVPGRTTNYMPIDVNAPKEVILEKYARLVFLVIFGPNKK